MSFFDVWIYNSRPRMRVFLCYLLIFVAFFIFFDIMIYFYTKSVYKPMEDYEINVTTPVVEVTEALASNVNGSVKGTIKNNTEETIENQYLKFEFYTPRDVSAGVKYLKIDTLQPGEEKKYELGFRYNTVVKVEITLADEEDTLNATPEELEISPIFGPVGIISGILFSYL